MTIARGLKAGSRCGIDVACVLAAALAGATTLPATAFAWSTAWVYSFTGGADGANPIAGVSLNPFNGSDNNLYGAAFFGGANGQGTLFTIPKTGGTPTVLRAFNATGDGAGPGGTPIVDASGNVLGTTAFASINSSQIGSGNGTVYAYSMSAASYSVVRTFSGGSTDGANSYSGLVSNCGGTATPGTKPYAFGTTTGGSSNSGTLFKLVPSGTAPGGYAYSQISSFSGSNGQNAYAPLVCDSFAGMYGTTVLGGSTGRGVTFSISTTATTPTLAYQLSSSTGGLPRGGLAPQDSAHLFGTTTVGGANNKGVVYELIYAGSGNWNYTTLHNFGSSASDGTAPWGTLTKDSSGNFYGTTTAGGASGNGTVFELVKSGTSYTYTPLYSFAGASDGANPYAALAVDPSTGRLYGTTQNGGANGKGTIFALMP